MVDYEEIKLRRKAWDANHPFFAGCGNSRNLHEKLKFYLRVAKHEEDDSPATIRKFEEMGDAVVSAVQVEIRKRAIEDDQIEEDKPTPQEVLKKEGRALKQELQKAIDRRPDTLILISRARGTRAPTQPPIPSRWLGLQQAPPLD